MNPQRMRQQINALRAQNSTLKEQNALLNVSLQDLIKINTQLTESLQNISDGNEQQKGKQQVNQRKIQSLAHQVISLEQELEKEKETASEVLSAVQQLAKSITEMQNHFVHQINILQLSLNTQRNQYSEKMQEIQNKYQLLETEYQKVVNFIKNNQRNAPGQINLQNAKIEDAININKNKKGTNSKEYLSIIQGIKEKFRKKI